MRLQVAVLRHDLPEVRLIFNTASKHGPGVARIVTVSDLLSAINALVPLESADGEWGLEDYLVEVAVTADQIQAYECFHFQELKDVLREDDEVVIRGLTNEELRERRQGGRLQITSDGRHLIDGLSWGKRWRAGVSSGRPEITIPPRKRRRIMMEPDQDDELKLQLEYPPSRESIPFVGGADEEYLDEDEDEDEDYDDNEGEDEDEDDYAEEDQSGDGRMIEDKHLPPDRDLILRSPRRITAKAAFDDADCLDTEVQDKGSASDNDEGSDLSLSEGAEDFAAELELLTGDAGMTMVDRKTTRHTAMRLAGSEAINSSQTNNTFHGFSSPPQVSPTNDVTHPLPSCSDPARPVQPATEIACEIGKARDADTKGSEVFEIVQHPNDKRPRIEDGLVEEQNQPSAVGNRKHQASVTSSSEEDSTEDSSDNSFSSQVSDVETSSDEDGTSSDSSSDSGESGSGGDSSLSSVRSATKSASPELEKSVVPDPTMNESGNTQKDLPRRNNPPGTGQNKTKRNNERKKMSKLLSNLKESGQLDKDADFKALRDYLANGVQTQVQQNEPPQSEVEAAVTQEKISARAEQILNQLNNTEGQDVSMEQSIETQHIATTSHDFSSTEHQTDKSMPEIDPTADPEATNTSTRHDTRYEHIHNDIQPISNESSPKRARLDVAASRRLLFSSLGVRNPRTAEAEQALRETLAKPARSKKNREPESVSEKMPQILPDENRWKKKFTMLAVECVQDWKTVESPPFPFKQPWQVRRERAEFEKASRQQEAYDQRLDYDEVGEDQDSQLMDVDHDMANAHPSESLTTSRTLTTGTSAEEDDIVEPSNFANLPTLTISNLCRTSVIAYKELHINTRFEPEPSSYRVARVLSHTDSTLRLKLTKRYRRSAAANYDEETGQRLYNRFEMPQEEDDEPDNGIREIHFEQMIDPRIVGTLDVDVTRNEKELSEEIDGNVELNEKPTLRGGHLGHAVEHLSRTLEDAVEFSTPRRVEINGLIKDAGLNSAIGDHLLGGLAHATAQEQKSLPVEERAIDGSHQSTPLQGTSPIRGVGESSMFRESSIPSDSMVESVRYPQLSHLEVDTPAPAQSSSHQDAQRPTPTPILPREESVIANTTFRESADQLNPEADPEPESLPSEVPQTQSQDLIPDSLDQTHQHLPQSSSYSPVPDYNLDVNDPPTSKSNHDHNAEVDDHEDDDDNESVDSSGFPSLRSLTSSQVRKSPDPKPRTRDRKSAVDKLKNSQSEPRRRSPRVARTTARSSDWSDTDPPSQLQAQRDPSFKASQSQGPRLSQIPHDTIVVDLTQSSPGSSMDENKKKENGNVTSTAEDRGARRAGQANPFRRSFEGLGEKSYLKRKKRGS